MTDRIHLSRAHVTQVEEDLVIEALRSGWVAPLGPMVDRFEAEMAQRVGVRAAVTWRPARRPCTLLCCTVERRLGGSSCSPP